MSSGTTQGLTEIYVRAAYTPSAVGAADRDEALAALMALRATIGERPAAT